MANPKHVEIVLQGKEAIDKWRKDNPKTKLDLSNADLGDTNRTLIECFKNKDQGTLVHSRRKQS